MSPEIGYVQSVPDWLGREQSAISSFKPRLQICRRLPMIFKFRDGTWALSFEEHQFEVALWHGLYSDQ